MMSESGSMGTLARVAKSGETARALVRRTKQITRRKFPAEEKIRILLEGIRAELCRWEGIHPTVYSYWRKDFMEVGNARMRGDSLWDATTAEVQHLKGEMSGSSSWWRS